MATAFIDDDAEQTSKEMELAEYTEENRNNELAAHTNFNKRQSKQVDKLELQANGIKTIIKTAQANITTISQSDTPKFKSEE